jgi:hypothetical protein
MPIRTVGSLHSIGGSPPFSGCCLARENQAGDPGSGEFFELGRDILATTILRIDEMPNIGVEVARSDWTIVVSIPPGGEQFDGGLPASVPLLGLTDPFDRITAAKGDKRVPYPPAPSLEAAQGTTLW